MTAEPQNPPIDQEDVDFDESIKETKFGQIKPTRITQEMQRSYLNYAMSVIVSRALPDVRDGLKPVHRRILFAMQDMGLTHKSSFKKSARIVGEVLGKYHPHGDTAVYDAMVRLAQDFSMRYPLINGQGNFGSVDGDSPAAMRYTEAKLQKITQEMLADLDKNTVPFEETFDSSGTEPTVLPANLPNLLLMGSEGIAVGMATKIPPHNLNELVSAITHLIQAGSSPKETETIFDKSEIGSIDPSLLTGNFKSQATIESLLEHIQGPDFPTGGIMFDWQEISQAYLTGKGRIVVRAKANIEEVRGGKMQIVITEIPYQVNKAKLVEKIALLVRNKKIVGISDLRDESDRQGMRIVIDLKRDSRPKSVLNNLFKYTPLQSSFPANMVALNSNGTPQLMNLKTILVEYVKHRQLVVTRRSQHDLLAALDRAHILEGLLIALDNLDEVIKIIRNSPDADTAKTRLMDSFKLSEAQAVAILDMQLRKLAALERKKIEDEYAALMAKIEYLTGILNSPAKILECITEELQSIAATYGDERRTVLVKGKLGEFSEDDLVPQEDVIITITETGYIKRIPPNTYRSQRRGGKGVSGMGTKDDDAIKQILSGNTHDNLLIFTDKGKIFKLRVYELPSGSRQSKGQAIINLINIDQGETIQNVLIAPPDLSGIKDKYVTLVTRQGIVKKTAVSEFQNIRTTGIIAIILNEGDELVWGDITNGTKDLILVTHHGKSIRFTEEQVRDTARDTKGVKGISLKKNDYVVAVEAIDPDPDSPSDKRRKFFNDIVIITEKGMGKRTPISEYPHQNRGGQGVKVANISTKTGNVAAAFSVTQDIEQIIITTKAAQIIKLPLRNIPQLKRPTQGVILMRFAAKQDAVVAATALEESNQDE